MALTQRDWMQKSTCMNQGEDVAEVPVSITQHLTLLNPSAGNRQGLQPT